MVELSTSYEEFANLLAEDKRAADLDSGNVKLTYNSVSTGGSFTLMTAQGVRALLRVVLVIFAPPSEKAV